MKPKAGINGFGRFGQHLLKYWLERAGQAPFSIDWIHDAKLSLEQAFDIITQDDYLGPFYKCRLKLGPHGLVARLADGRQHSIVYTSGDSKPTSWLGLPDLFLECSGRHTDATTCQNFLGGNTQLVIVSATSLNADALLVYGYNHHRFNPKQRVVSYGSCTVNAFVPLAHFLDQHYGVKESDVHVIHNVPGYTLSDHTTLVRKPCTLETVAPRLLGFIQPHNFTVNYTLIPYTGVSVMDLRFELQNSPSPTQLVHSMEASIRQGALKDLYLIAPEDKGPNAHKFTTVSAVLVKPNIKLVGNNLYLHTYFDNENSVNRYYDLAVYTTRQIKGGHIHGQTGLAKA